MRPIDGDALAGIIEIAARNLIDTGYSPHGDALREAATFVKKFPTIEAEPVRRGAWGKERLGRFQNVNTGKFSTAYKYTCNRCGWSTGEQAKGFHFCPMCGAKMDAKEED